MTKRVAILEMTILDAYCQLALSSLKDISNESQFKLSESEKRASALLKDLRESGTEMFDSAIKLKALISEYKLGITFKSSPAVLPSKLIECSKVAQEKITQAMKVAQEAKVFNEKAASLIKSVKK